jgi:cell division septation protein DedD
VVFLIPLCLGGCGSSNSAKTSTAATVPGSSLPASVPTTTSAQASTQPVQTTGPAQATQPSQTAQTSPSAQTQQTNTPEEAIMAYWRATGDGSSIVFKRSKYSASDPAWAYYDYQRFEGMQHFVFLVHKSSGLWAVVAMANNGPFNATDHGGPADLTYP